MNTAGLLRLVSIFLFFGLFSLSGCRLYDPMASRPLPALPPAKIAAKYQPLPPAKDADSSIHLVNTAASAGLHYRWVIHGTSPFSLLQTIGNGCAFLDYDDDGKLDILLIGPRLVLYKGDSKGGFADETAHAGLDRLVPPPGGQFLGCAVGDFDNDGYPDVYVSGYRTALLLHNERGSRFRDVAAAMGLAPQPWGTSCAWADLDGDGFLDLVVVNYLKFDAASPQRCLQNGVMTACSPTMYPALRGVVYRNVSGVRFEDVTRRWGAKTSGNSLGVACADFEGSDRVGLAIANDEMDGDLFQNQGRVEPRSEARLVNLNGTSGTSTDRFGHRHGGMGVDWGDVDNDGKPDLFVTTFAHEDKCLYHNLGEGLFEERGLETGIASALEPYVAFGCKFADFDNDGWLDLLVASGHVQDNAAAVNQRESYRQPVELLRNTGASAGSPIAFARVTDSAGLSGLRRIVGRGLAVGDFDNDGRVDALVVDGEGSPLLLHNQTPVEGHHWIGFRLIGKGRSNRDAYGAVVTVERGKRRLSRPCRADGSYLSSSDSRVHVGLGEGSKGSVVDRATVRWPDGRIETRTNLSTDHYLTWLEGRP